MVAEALNVMDIVVCVSVSAALGYLVGCISPSYIIGLIKGYDVRSSGSKNAGASNTVLLAGKLAGLFVAIFDIFKATAAWELAAFIFPEMEFAGMVGGVGCVIGHMFPVFLHFHGGKGFACMGGLALAAGPRTFFIMLGVALIIGIVTNYVAVSCTAMSVVWPLYYGLTTRYFVGAAILAIPAIPIFLKHMENFRRMREGTELRLSYLWQKDSELERIGHKE